MTKKLASIALLCATLLAGCESIYAPPTSGSTAQFTTIYQREGLDAVVQVRQYPEGKPSIPWPKISYMKNLGGEAVRGHVPTYRETYSIPAGKDFHFGFHLIASKYLTVSTCTIDMRVQPEAGQHYEIVFSSFPNRCSVAAYRVQRQGDGSTQRIVAPEVIQE